MHKMARALPAGRKEAGANASPFAGSAPQAPRRAGIRSGRARSAGTCGSIKSFSSVRRLHRKTRLIMLPNRPNCEGAGRAVRCGTGLGGGSVARYGSLIGHHRSRLEEQGLFHLGAVHWNLTAPLLYEHAVRRREGEIGAGGSFVVRTGPHTGRSPRDKYIVEEPGTKHAVWWGPINQPIAPERFKNLHQRLLAYFQGREVFVQDLYAGADPEYRLPVRVISDSAWHSLFSRNMFIRPPAAELEAFEPAFTILHAPEFRAVPALDGTRSETFILVNFADRLVLIGGTRY